MTAVRAYLVFVMVVLLGGPAAADNRTKEIEALAKDIQKYAAGQGIKSFTIDRFVAKPGETFECGPGLACDLERALTNEGLAIVPNARHVIKGEYWRARDAERNDCVIIQFAVHIFDGDKCSSRG